ncbi:unnamed protein product [Effrenium voratum]|nr:unnamed protein product [Effrenium voratum]
MGFMDKEQWLGYALAVCKYGDSWWLPLVLLAVSTLNSVTGGMLTWSVGLFQMALFNIIILSRKYTFFLGPLMLSLGSLVAGVFYVQMMRSEGADALLAYAGVKDSSWLEKAKVYAKDYGVLGLVGMQVIPVPIPSAVIVIAGMLAQMDEFKILATVFISKFIQLTLGALGLKFATENQSAEELIRQQMQPADKAKTEDEKKTGCALALAETLFKMDKELAASFVGELQAGATDPKTSVRRGFLELMDTMPQAMKMDFVPYIEALFPAMLMGITGDKDQNEETPGTELLWRWCSASGISVRIASWMASRVRIAALCSMGAQRKQPE